MQKESDYFRLRVPEKTKVWVRERAAENMRSMTAEINHILATEMKRDAEKEGDNA
ncbi:FitA-like ribbon-helix-helix domain-containing protein [Pseudovibrio sp. SPO723]|uniref:FitA-like ribbon-helix-helix domain-containing protein n=1 Tax=Nesiotobacter zosterae TaxID=392721 RepID=UPI0029C543EA|nr:Arc family DNA-binding protein [Pseudovibrio sp. SPO723]MDX5592596.1 Arc family DNA-binding protein [Pseudovibrio sp. SPO723]